MRMKLETVLECLLNGERDEARKMLHEYIVDSSRSIYSEMDDSEVEDGEEELMDEASMYEVDGDDEMIAGDDAPMFGGDQSDDFMGDVEGDLEADDVDGEMMGDMDDGMGEELSVDDRLAEIESSIDELMSEFHRLMGEDDEADVDGDDMGAAEFEPADDDGEDDGEGFPAKVAEATNFAKKVSVDMSKEGQEAGNGKSVSVDTGNRFASGKKVSAPVGSPVKQTGGDEKGQATPKYAKEKAPSQTDIKGGKAPAVETKPKHDDNVKPMFSESKKKTK